MSDQIQTLDFSSQAGQGLDNVSNEDIQIPYLQIIQTNSPEVDKANQDHAIKGITGASSGDIFNTQTRQILSPFGQALTVIPIHYEKAYVEWRPREDGGGIVNVHKSSGILNDTERNEKNKDILPNGNIVETTAYHMVLYKTETNEWQKAIISMQSTQLKKSRQWLSKATSIRLTGPNGSYTPPIFSHTYLLSAVTESNKHGSWFGWKVEIEGAITDQEDYKIAVDSSEAYTQQLVSSDQPKALDSKAEPF
jgi:hypothetical protein